MKKDDALFLFESKFWEPLTHRQRAEFQMHERLLCMPFSIFHEAVEKTLGRPVYTHEFGLDYEGLKKELMGNREPPSFAEILALLPAEKTIVVVTP